MQKKTETSVGPAEQMADSPGRGNESASKSPSTDVSVLPPEIALALVETERDFLVGKVRDAAAAAESMKQRLDGLEAQSRALQRNVDVLQERSATVQSALQGRVEKLEESSATLQRSVEQLEQQLSAANERAARLEANTAELSRQLREVGAGTQESLSRFVALLRRTGRVKTTSLLRALRRVPPRKMWRVAKDYKLVASSPLFDRKYYLNRYPDVLHSGFDPILHYLLFGGTEGRLPGPNFDAARYLDANPDVRKTGANPLVHFLNYGVFEGRSLGLTRPFPANLSDTPAQLPIRSKQAAHIDAPRPLKQDPQLWFFVGDSTEWLNIHEQLTGVGKVSSELLLASFECALSQRAQPCLFGNNPLELVAASDSKQYANFLQKIGASRLSHPSGALRSDGRRAPEPGDHVFFTGHVWTPRFTNLFRHLAQQNIDFSVLVFDIIPIEWPELLGQAAHQSFAEWLATTVNTANVIFVSSSLVKDQIQRWSAISGIEVRAEINVIRFGLRHIADACSREELANDPRTAKVDLSSFVLCVGTVDRRKNQLFLCHIWKQLADILQFNELPQLVLAGRDDLNLGQNPEVAELISAGKILVLRELPDKHLAGLYKHCLFTAFPSLSEGYGLPVAESLQYGKLCVASSLAVVREHAGDLVWYFSPDNSRDALELFARAIRDSDKRKAAEERIRSEFSPPKWTETYQAMAATAHRVLRRPAVDVESGPQRPQYPGARKVDPGVTLARAAQWCRGDDPEVSILIINWNAARLTLECLRQIWSQTDGHSYEIIIVDNGSAPADVAQLRNLGTGVRLLELGCNRFFGEANNIAAEHARGRYLCLLNNDAFVQEGWLTALIRGVEQSQEVGAVGPMFLFPDGRIQEAGGAINAHGYPMRVGRGETQESLNVLSPRFVDYISAAAFLLEREVFLLVGGFDLAYEPAYYEDVDLCFKIQALGRKILYCPEAKVIHIEGHSANDNAAAETRRKVMGDINRGKFVSKWEKYLHSRDQAMLTSLASTLPLRHQSRSDPASPIAKPPHIHTAAIYTPYSLTCGGGEIYFLTMAAILAKNYQVTLITPHPYSNLRLQNIGTEFELDLSQVQLMTNEQFIDSAAPDVMLTIGNHIIPDVYGRGKANVFICQFPFRMNEDSIGALRPALDSYQRIVVYSEYVRAHVYGALNAYHLPPKPVAVIHPPVRQITGDASNKKNIVLCVGRFFVGGHSKRHDALIEAFKKMASRFKEPVEFHLAGSATPEPQHMDYLAKLMSTAEGFPIHFHVNASSEKLHQLYRDAAVYWHGTGIGADLAAAPEKAEHFGISIVEAMSAGAVPFALNAGGPREIIDHGKTGFLYDTPEELVLLTLDLLAKPGKERLEIGRHAQHRAMEFSCDKFQRKISSLAEELIGESIERLGEHVRAETGR